MRCLLVCQRVVAAQQADEYRTLWNAVTRHATSVSARAWVFRSATENDRYIEFVEWPCAGDAVTTMTTTDANEPPPSVAAALARLDTIAPPLAGSAWKEWKTA